MNEEIEIIRLINEGNSVKEIFQWCWEETSLGEIPLLYIIVKQKKEIVGINKKEFQEALEEIREPEQVKQEIFNSFLKLYGSN